MTLPLPGAVKRILMVAERSKKAISCVVVAAGNICGGFSRIVDIGRDHVLADVVVLVPSHSE